MVLNLVIMPDNVTGQTKLFVLARLRRKSGWERNRAVGVSIQRHTVVHKGVHRAPSRILHAALCTVLHLASLHVTQCSQATPSTPQAARPNDQQCANGRWPSVLGFVGWASRPYTCVRRPYGPRQPCLLPYVLGPVRIPMSADVYMWFSLGMIVYNAFVRIVCYFRGNRKYRTTFACHHKCTNLSSASPGILGHPQRVRRCRYIAPRYTNETVQRNLHHTVSLLRVPIDATIVIYFLLRNTLEMMG